MALLLGLAASSAGDVSSTSSTSESSAVELSAIEQQKENIQPLVAGRSAKALHTLFTSDRKTLQDDLREGHDRFQEEIEHVEQEGADDPLDVYHRYVRWTLSSYPSGPSHSSHLVPLLERATRRFVHEEQYTSDIRLLKLWILYAKYVDCPKDIFRFLEGLQVCVKLASFYEEWAMLEEQSDNLGAADAIYNLGIARRAQPMERLRKRREAFQARMLLPRSPPRMSGTAESLATKGPSAVRSILNATSTLSAPSFRGTASLAASVSTALPNNGASGFAVFRDGGESCNTIEGQDGWNDFGTNLSRKKENDRPAVPWKGETLSMNSTAPPVRSMRLEVFKDEDADIPAAQSPNLHEQEGLATKSMRAPGEAEMLRKNPFRNYSNDVHLVNAPELPTSATASTINEWQKPSRPMGNINSSSKPTFKSSLSSSKDRTAASSSSSSSSSFNPSSSLKKSENVASPLCDIYPDGPSGPEYSIEEIMAAKRGLRDVRSGKLLASTLAESQEWEKEVRAKGTTWRMDAAGEIVLRDLRTGDALFEYIRIHDELERNGEAERKADEEERERRASIEHQNALEESEVQDQRDREYQAKQDAVDRANRKIEAQESEERALVNDAVHVSEEAEKWKRSTKEEEEEVLQQGQATEICYHRPSSPTINTKAALAEVNAMFSKTMRFEENDEDIHRSTSSYSGNEGSSSSDEEEEDEGDGFDHNAGALPPSQAETDDTFWLHSQSQSQQPLCPPSQQSLQSHHTSESVGVGSESSGNATEESDAEQDHPQPRHLMYEKSQKSVQSQNPPSRFLLSESAPSVPVQGAQDGRYDNENIPITRPAFRPTRKPLSAKISSTALGLSGRPGYGVSADKEDLLSEVVSTKVQRILVFSDENQTEESAHDQQEGDPLADPTEPFEIGEQISSYAMGRRMHGNNRFAGMMDVMTPITERTCEFGTLSTIKTGSTSTGERPASLIVPSGDEDDAVGYHQKVYPEDLASSRGSNWDGRRRSLECVGEEEEEEETQQHNLAGELSDQEIALGFNASILANCAASACIPSENLASNSETTTSCSIVPCDPLNAQVVQTILERPSYPLSSLSGFYDCRTEVANKLAGLQKVAKSRRKSSSARSSSVSEEIAWGLTLHTTDFSVREKLGEGGYGAVFRVAELHETAVEERDEEEEDDSSEALLQIALKVESPTNLWEYYIINLLQSRLPLRTRQSVVRAHRLYAFSDESHLLIDCCDQGTLLDSVNHAQQAGVGPAGTSALGFEEVVAIFFTVELTRILESFHAAGFLHGDFKVDNCLVRLDEVPGGPQAWTSGYKRDGSSGWASKGVRIIDFGRTIDMQAFPDGQTFSTTWTTDMHDCAEMREGKPWTYQPDYFGLACIAHVLLFGKYLETVSHVNEETGKTRYTLKEPFRRYHQIPLWTRFFDLLLNPCLVRKEGGVPITEELATTRNKMEDWLEAHSERSGKSLKSLLKKLEIEALSRHR